MTEMTTDPTLIILVLAAGTLSVRLLGVVIGQGLPTEGAWARALNALPGCLIVSLVSVILASGGRREWIAGAIALGVAIPTRSLPVTMIAGIAAIWTLRHFGIAA